MNSNCQDVNFIHKALGYIYQFFLGGNSDKKPTIALGGDTHAEYQSSVGRYWIEIYQDLEVSLQISTCLCESESKIAIRTISDKVFEVVEILVEAEGYFNESFRDERYTAQQRLVFHNVGLNPKIKSLYDIPAIELLNLENGDKIFSYEELSIFTVSLCQSETTEAIQHKTVVHIEKDGSQVKVS